MNLTVRVETLRLRHAFTTSRESRREVPTVIVELEHDGIIGRGEGSPSLYYGFTSDMTRDALAAFAPRLAGRSADTYRTILDDAKRALGGNRAALAALDIALHDWLGKRYQVPLHTWFGLPAGPIPVSSFTLGIGGGDAMQEKLLDAAGRPILKVKAGAAGDMERLRALRAETDRVIRVDANCGWSAEEALGRIEELASLGVELLEQPLKVADDAEMDRLFRASPIPLIADESAVSPAALPALVGRFHGINVKVVKHGGLLPTLTMITLARELGLSVMIGCMIESSVGITASAHLGALVDHVDLDGNVLIDNDPYVGVVHDEGRLTLPRGFGLGVVPA